MEKLNYKKVITLALIFSFLVTAHVASAQISSQNPFLLSDTNIKPRNVIWTVGTTTDDATGAVIDGGFERLSVGNLTVTTCSGCGGGGGSSFGQAWEFPSGITNAIRPTTTVGIIANASSSITNLSVGFGTTTHATSTNFHYSGSLRGLNILGTPTYSTLQHFMNFGLSPGVSSGGTISTTTNSASVTAGTGFIKATDSDVAALNFHDWSASSTVNISNGAKLYLGVDYNSGSPALVARTTQDWNYDTNYPVGTLVNDGKVYSIYRPWATADAMANVIERFDSIAYIARDNRTGGLTLSNTGTRNVSVTAGALLSRLSEYTIAALDTSSGGVFDAYYRNGSGGWTKESDQTQWNNTQYDDGSGTKASLTALAYTSRWFYVMTDGTLATVYGQSQDLDLADIVNESPPSSVPDRINEMGILIGRFIIRASGSTPTVTQTAFGTAFTSAVVTSHSNLADLAWTSSGHTGTANHIPYFNSTGAAASSANMIFDGTKLTVSSLQSTNATSTNATSTTLYLSGRMEADGLVDFSGATSFAAPSNFGGRSLTVNSTALDADAELYTDTFSIVVASSTMSTTTSVAQIKRPYAWTIVRISCSTDVGTTTIRFDERSEGTENTAGSALLGAPGLRCGSGTDTNASSTIADNAVADDAIANFEISDAAPNGTKATNLRVHVEYTKND